MVDKGDEGVKNFKKWMISFMGTHYTLSLNHRTIFDTSNEAYGMKVVYKKLHLITVNKLMTSLRDFF